MIPALTGLYCGRLISCGRGKHIRRKINTWELIVVLRGQLNMFCGEENCCLEKDDAMLIPPFTLHGGTKQYPPNLTFYWLHFLPKDKAAEELLHKTDTVMHLSDTVRLNILMQFYQSLKSDPVPDTEKIDAIAGLILHEVLLRKSHTVETFAEEANSNETSSLLRNVQQILTTRYREALSTGTLASELGYSANYLGHLYGKHFGHGIIEELHNQRITHACDLLARSSLTISEILYEIGYNDPAQFRRQFFRRKSMSPHEYRNQIKKELINAD